MSQTVMTLKETIKHLYKTTRYLTLRSWRSWCLIHCRPIIWFGIQSTVFSISINLHQVRGSQETMAVGKDLLRSLLVATTTPCEDLSIYESKIHVTKSATAIQRPTTTSDFVFVFYSLLLRRCFCLIRFHLIRSFDSQGSNLLFKG